PWSSTTFSSSCSRSAGSVYHVASAPMMASAGALPMRSRSSPASCSLRTPASVSSSATVQVLLRSCAKGRMDSTPDKAYLVKVFEERKRQPFTQTQMSGNLVCVLAARLVHRIQHLLVKGGQRRTPVARLRRPHQPWDHPLRHLVPPLTVGVVLDQIVWPPSK